MADNPFEAERHRLRQEMQHALEQVRTTYQRRLDAVDRAEELMRFAASGQGETPVGDESPAARIPTTGSLSEGLARWLAGVSEPFSLADAEARFPDAAPDELRTCLAQMAKDGMVKIVEAGEVGQPTRYEVPEPDYAGVPARDDGP